ncbi:Resolvase, N terminal domain [Novosphingobium sp. CF614]|uniref:recombinase family protein n=1 Tax=Novosphingobium sp. CF614 TaxID=1884364 RepID=UPI0008E51052|nr:recombinase family protein [Novosphingobium sp. CF614]SFF97046.1 Resolvase, N terminal domain [Novosphingobium sp. CF614]
MDRTAIKTKAVIYARVSSAAQVAKGHGAESQAVRCSEFARMKGYTVVRTFEDKAVSGSLVERPGMKMLLAYLHQHRKENIRVLIDDISRLARGLEAHLTLRAAIAKAGGVLESPSIEFGEDSDSQLIEHLLASVSAHARVKNAEQVRNRQEARIRQGYWPFFAPTGLRFENLEGHGKVMVRDEPLASIMQEGMEGYASGRFQSQAEVARFFESQPDFPKTRHGTVTIETVNRIFNRVIYAGMIERPEWGVSLRKGKHEGLIDFATFEKIHARLKGRSYAAARPDISADFPLRGCVSCADCERPLTANWSRSKTGDKHPYYMCFNRDCQSYRKSIRRVEIEGAFDKLLDGMEPSPSMLRIFRAMFTDAWEMQRQQAQQTASAFKRAVTKADEEIARLLERIVSSTSSETVIVAYEKRIAQLEREKLVLSERHSNAGKPLRPFGEMFELANAFLSKPSNLWKSDRIEDKQTVIRLVFADRITYARNQGFRTPKTSPIFKALEAMKTGNYRMAETPSATKDPPRPP